MRAESVTALAVTAFGISFAGVLGAGGGRSDPVQPPAVAAVHAKLAAVPPLPALASTPTPVPTATPAPKPPRKAHRRATARRAPARAPVVVVPVVTPAPTPKPRPTPAATFTPVPTPVPTRAPVLVRTPAPTPTPVRTFDDKGQANNGSFDESGGGTP